MNILSASKYNHSEVEKVIADFWEREYLSLRPAVLEASLLC
jgi:hypothetical protein